MTNHSVATFEARCTDCEAVFATPYLGDFAYGEFLLFGDQGTAYAFLIAFENPVWRLAESLACPNVMRAVAGVADQVDGQAMCAEAVCPACHSCNLASWGGIKVASIDIPEASFVSFNRLSQEEKERRLRQHGSEE